MRLSEFNERYEEILHSNAKQAIKNKQLANLMTDMEYEFNIPALRDAEWEKENKPIIELYRKISNSRKF